MKMTKEKQKEWAQLKYLIMSRSQEDYLEIRKLFRDNTWDEAKELEFQKYLQHALATNPTKGSLLNAYQHVWGYFKKIATEAEKERYCQLLEEFSVEKDVFLPFLQFLAQKYEVTYLLESKLLFDDSTNIKERE